MPSSFANSGCPSATAGAGSNVDNLSRKLASTVSASAAVNVFLAARFLWTQVAP